MGEKNVDWLPPVHTPTRDQTCSQGMCTDWESNWRPRDDAPTNWATQPGQDGLLSGTWKFGLQWLMCLRFLLRCRWWRKPRPWWRVPRRRWIAWGGKGKQTGMCLIWSPSTYSLARGKLVRRTGDSVLIWSSLARLLFVSWFDMIPFHKVGLKIYELQVIVK